MNYVRRQFNFNRAGSHALHACADPEYFVRGVLREDRNVTKMDHHRPISETPLSIRPIVECWLGSFVILGDPDQYC